MSNDASTATFGMFHYHRYVGEFLKKFPQHENIRKIRRIDIFDFDNTLFRSPVPNPQLWHTSLIHRLRDPKLGWYQDVRTLSHPYVDCNPRTAKQWFVPSVVSAVRRSQQDPSSLTVLLTGRRRDVYLKRVLEYVRMISLKFDLVVLREDEFISTVDDCQDSLRSTSIGLHPHLPRIEDVPKNTLDFKLGFIRHLLQRFTFCEEIYVYEDRAHHATAFETFFRDLEAQYPLLKSTVKVVDPGIRYMHWHREWELVHQLVHECLESESISATNGVTSRLQVCPIPIWGSVQFESLHTLPWDDLLPSGFSPDLSRLEPTVNIRIPISQDNESAWASFLRQAMDRQEPLPSSIPPFEGLPTPKTMTCRVKIVGTHVESTVTDTREELSGYLVVRIADLGDLMLTVPIPLSLTESNSIHFAQTSAIKRVLPNTDHTLISTSMRVKAVYGLPGSLPSCPRDRPCVQDNLSVGRIINDYIKNGNLADEAAIKTYQIDKLVQRMTPLLMSQAIPNPVRWEDVDRVRRLVADVLEAYPKDV